MRELCKVAKSNERKNIDKHLLSYWYMNLVFSHEANILRAFCNVFMTSLSRAFEWFFSKRA